MNEFIVSEKKQKTLNKNINVLTIFMGGDREIDSSIEEVKKLSDSGLHLKILLTPAAVRIIGEDRIKKSNPGKLLSDSENLNSIELIKDVDIILVPVLTLSGLSKISNLITDSLHINTIIHGIRRKIPIIAARESIFCCEQSNLPFSSGFMRKVDEMINQLKNYGVKIVPVKKLSREVFDIFNIINTDKKEKIEIQKNNNNEADENKSSISCVNCNLTEKKEIIKLDSPILNKGSKEIFDIKLAAMIDHTSLKPNVTQTDIVKLCEEAIKYNFATVCVNPSYVSFVSGILKNYNIGITTVIGFPLGANTSIVKSIEARDAIANGATEIDMVINIGALKSDNLQLVLDDIKAVRVATKNYILKVIIETVLLNTEEIIKASKISMDANADFVKTSTGFSSGGATENAIKIIKQTIGDFLKIKASGGINTNNAAWKMINAGASRIGSSASVALVTGK